MDRVYDRTTERAAARVLGLGGRGAPELPNAAGATIRSILTQTAEDLETWGRDDNTGAGMVNAEAAVRKAMAKARDPQLANLLQPLYLLPITSGISLSSVGTQFHATITPDAESGDGQLQSAVAAQLAMDSAMATGETVSDAATAFAAEPEKLLALDSPVAAMPPVQMHAAIDSYFAGNTLDDPTEADEDSEEMLQLMAEELLAVA